MPTNKVQLPAWCFCGTSHVAQRSRVFLHISRNGYLAFLPAQCVNQVNLVVVPEDGHATSSFQNLSSVLNFGDNRKRPCEYFI